MNYSKIYAQLIERARHRSLTGYTESHHIIPKCMGGTNDASNLVELLPEEHFIAHQLLVKINPDHSGLVWAATMMTWHSSTKRNTNKLYGWLRRKLSDRAKARVGSKNGSFGSMWIHNCETHEAKKIKKVDPIPDGWDKGRVAPNKCSVCGDTCGKALYCNSHANEARAKHLDSVRNTHKGKRYVNNGVEQIVIGMDEEIPDGYSLGGKSRKRKRKRKRK